MKINWQENKEDSSKKTISFIQTVTASKITKEKHRW